MTSPMRFKINTPDVIYESFDNEVFIIHFETGSYYSLDKSGKDIWEVIKGGATAIEIIEHLTHMYKGPREHKKTAVNQLIAELQRENLIVPGKVEESGCEGEAKGQVEKHPETEKLRFETPALQKYTDMQELLLLDPIHDIDYTDFSSKKQNTLEDY